MTKALDQAWDPSWEKVHAAREWGSYPDEALIRFTARHYYKAEPRAAVRFLDLGCGGGAATWYLCREGFDVSAIDGSKSALASVERRLQRDGYSANLALGDVTALPFEGRSFDCVVEIGCLTCLPRAAAVRAIDEVRRVLKPGGRLLSYTPASGCWGDGLGREVEADTFDGASEGPFAGLGLVRFISEDQIPSLYSGFSSVAIDRVDRTVDERKHTVSQWSIVCQL